MDHDEDAEREEKSRAMTLLLAHGTTGSELQALARIALRAGFLWKCPACRANLYPNRASCCDNPRPAYI